MPAVPDVFRWRSDAHAISSTTAKLAELVIESETLPIRVPPATTRQRDVAGGSVSRGAYTLSCLAIVALRGSAEAGSLVAGLRDGFGRLMPPTSCTASHWR